MVTWKEIAEEFVRTEIRGTTYERTGAKSKPGTPDFIALAESLQPYNREDRAKAWWYVVTEIDDVAYPDIRIKCYLEQLYNNPVRESVSWDWLAGKYNPTIKVLSPDAPRTRETIAAVRRRIGSFSSDSTSSETGGMGAADVMQPDSSRGFGWRILLWCMVLFGLLFIARLTLVMLAGRQTAAAMSALAHGEAEAAQTHAKLALRFWPWHVPAQALNRQAETKLTFLTAGERARGKGAWTEVLAWAEATLAVQRDHPRALTLKCEAVTELTLAEALTDAEAARAWGGWPEVKAQAETALAVRGEHPRALALKREAELALAVPAVKRLASADLEIGKPWLIPGLEMMFLPIAPGTFMMGSKPIATQSSMMVERDNTPMHMVRLTRPYWLGKCEVTQGEYLAVMGKNSSTTFTGEDNPVACVTWFDTMSFCKKLTERERQAKRILPGYEYILPTEAEWEYACRAGSRGEWFFGDDPAQLAEYAWMSGIHAVGTKKANAWGFCDMYGNVNEMCLDWHAPYPRDSVTDPYVPPPPGLRKTSYPVARGGCGVLASSTIREGSGDGYSEFEGFRVALAPVIKR